PGIVTVPINAAWTERLALPATKGKWQRFSRTFTPAQADCSFKLRVLSESVTRGIDIDDVCLVAGDKCETGMNLIPNGDFETSWSAQRVARELPDMEKMAERLARELAATKDFPRVPRWHGDTLPTIAGPSFVDKTGRPVFFVGYGHFDQVRRDIEKFPAYGINIVQHGEFGPAQVFVKEDQIDDTPI